MRSHFSARWRFCSPYKPAIVEVVVITEVAVVRATEAATPAVAYTEAVVMAATEAATVVAAVATEMVAVAVAVVIMACHRHRPTSASLRATGPTAFPVK